MILDPLAIAVDDLTYAYPGSVTALRNIRLEVAAGECVGLVSPNGAGKTPLFLCLAGVLPVPRDRCRVAVLDPANRAERPRLAAQVGIIFQNSDDQLFNATVLDDVAF